MIRRSTIDTGTGPRRSTVCDPTRVSVAALSTEETTLTFAGAGTILYICHFPGHEAYGMVGTLTVT